MKPWLVALLLIPLLPLVQAQDDLQEVATEGTGDVSGAALLPNGLTANTNIPAGTYKSVDLVGLYVQEKAETIHFELEAESLGEDNLRLLQDGKYFVGFTHNDQPFVAVLYYSFTDQVYSWGILVKQDISQGGFDFITPLTVTIEENRLLVDLQREDLTDTNGAAPYPGRTLTRFFAQSHLRSSDGIANIANIAIGNQFDAVDTIPDSGPSNFVLPIKLGLQQRGHASLISANPMRASNGEATTFVYTLDATNNWDREDSFDITASNVPGNWEVILQDPIVTLAAGETKQIPLLVSIPFLHEHGVVKTFDVKMESHWEDNSVGHAQIGVRFHEVPQPAGHHNEIFFHTQQFGDETSLTGVATLGFSGGIAAPYFNTLENDENDDKIAITGNYQGWGYHPGTNVGEVPQSLWRWQMFLQPGLEMGLDFDLSSEGTATFPFSTTLPIPGAQLKGELYHWGYNPSTEAWTRTVIAQMDTGAPRDFANNEIFQFTFNIKPNVDELPYLKDAFLGIDWNLTSSRPSMFTGVEAPTMEPNGKMALPLFEYTDPVDEIFPSLGAVRIHMASEAERAVNPGKAIIFQGMVMNHQDIEDKFTFSLAGVNKDWATGLPLEPVKIGSNEEYQFQILVAAPEGALDNELADLVLTVKGTGEARALVRLVANVDTKADIPDEGHLKIEEAEEAPPAMLGLVMLGVAMLAIRRRK